MDAIKQNYKKLSDTKFYNQVINAETASINSLNPDQLYQDPLLKDKIEKEKFQKKILLKKKSYIKQVNENMKAQASVVVYR